MLKTKNWGFSIMERLITEIGEVECSVTIDVKQK